MQSSRDGSEADLAGVPEAKLETCEIRLENGGDDLATQAQGRNEAATLHFSCIDYRGVLFRTKAALKRVSLHTVRVAESFLRKNVQSRVPRTTSRLYFFRSF